MYRNAAFIIAILALGLAILDYIEARKLRKQIEEGAEDCSCNGSSSPQTGIDTEQLEVLQADPSLQLPQDYLMN